ncbi:hypothetical protein EYB31_30150 [Paenibacillus thalictri]|uniref:YqzN/YkzM domain-containing protein n=1 Tax=Paenibacillus thalictri TaxID=2527873 RepID=A0A4Q9DGT0_9BACL|nr:hypothetical protein EYB31_30150 [Paenibacillus thalictri]
MSSAKPKERVYTKDELIDQAEALFQVKKEVVLGALYGNTQEHFSLNELRGTIKQFLLRKVEA